MHTKEYEERRRRGLPIASGRELVHALLAVQRLTAERSALWFLLNRLMHTAMAFADDEERTNKRGRQEDGADKSKGD
jgi:hypothetical protein